MLVRPLEVLELGAGPGVLEVLLLLLLVRLGVRDAVLHHVLEAPDQACNREERRESREVLEKR